MDLVEGDRLRAEFGLGAADEWAVRSIRCAIRQGTIGVELSASGGSDGGVVSAGDRRGGRQHFPDPSEVCTVTEVLR